MLHFLLLGQILTTGLWGNVSFQNHSNLQSTKGDCFSAGVCLLNFLDCEAWCVNFKTRPHASDRHAPKQVTMLFILWGY